MSKVWFLSKVLFELICHLSEFISLLSLHLAAWTEFKSEGCSASCGEGTERFTRACVGAGECEGDDFLEQPCKDLPVCGKTNYLANRILTKLIMIFLFK